MFNQPDFSTTYFQPRGKDEGDDLIALCTNGDQEMLLISADRSACLHKVEAIPTLEANKVMVIISKTWIEEKMSAVRSEEEAEQVIEYIMHRAMLKGMEALANAGAETL